MVTGTCMYSFLKGGGGEEVWGITWFSWFSGGETEGISRV